MPLLWIIETRRLVARINHCTFVTHVVATSVLAGLEAIIRDFGSEFSLYSLEFHGSDKRKLFKSGTKTQERIQSVWTDTKVIAG